MKVLLLNGSTRTNGCTYLALSEIEKELKLEGIEAEILQMGSKPVWDCTGCNSCKTSGKCVFKNDIVNEWLTKAREADGYVFGSPVYYAHPSGQLLAVMDRLFMAGGDIFFHKPAAAIVTARHECYPKAFCRCADARCIFYILEHGIRPVPGASGTGSGRAPNDAKYRTKHGMDASVYCSRKRKWHPAAGS